MIYHLHHPSGVCKRIGGRTWIHEESAKMKISLNDCHKHVKFPLNSDMESMIHLQTTRKYMSRGKCGAKSRVTARAESHVQSHEAKQTTRATTRAPTRASTCAIGKKTFLKATDNNRQERILKRPALSQSGTNCMSTRKEGKTFA